MILGILLGLMSLILVLSLGLSGYLYTKLVIFTIKLENLETGARVFSMFKEQALAEITHLKLAPKASEVPMSIDAIEDYFKSTEFAKMSKDNTERFDLEYLSSLEERRL